MRQWFIGFNDYWFTACIFLEEVPFHLVALDFLVERVCWLLNKIPFQLPKKRFRLRNKEDWDCTEHNDGWTDLREWYGSIGQLWHAFVCIPTTNFIHKKTKSSVIYLPYFFLKERFPEAFESEEDLCGDGEKIEINREKAQDLDKEFRNAYNKFNEQVYR